MSQYSNDLSNWEKTNIFLNDSEFTKMQMSLVPVKVLKGSYETYSTQISPRQQQSWLHLILLPGTAFKFSNKLNAQYTAHSLLSILEIKNIPTKIHAISHRINPIFPQASTDTLEMLQIILKTENINQISIITWSGGCSHLEQCIQLAEKNLCKIERVFLVSPVVDLSNKSREKKSDFLNQDFFDFFFKVYSTGNQQKVKQLSLTESLKKQKQTNFIIKIPLTIIYGSQQYIREDIEEYIKLVNELKIKLKKQPINFQMFENENHALYSFVTSSSTQSDKEAMAKISKTKWLVSKYIADQTQNCRGTAQTKIEQFEKLEKQ